MKNSSNAFKTENCADQTKYGHGPESVPALPICSSFLGPNAHCFPTGMNHSRPMSQANGGSEATHTPGDNPSKIQNHCQEPYYQAVPAGESPPTGELVPTCLAPTKRPEALWAPTLLAPLLPVLRTVPLPTLFSFLRDSRLHITGPLEGDTGQQRGSSLCAW